MPSPKYRSVRDVLNTSLGFNPRQMSGASTFTGEFAGFIVLTDAAVTFSKLKGASAGTTDIAATFTPGQYALSGTNLDMASGDIILLLW